LKLIDINTWNRKQHFEHFSRLEDPTFAVTIPFDVTKAYNFSKEKDVSFFGKYLHDCMRAINSVNNFKYRIIDNKVFELDVIHASPTIMREDKTFGFSFIDYDEDLGGFLNNLEAEKLRINNSTDLFPEKEGVNCIFCSALPWFQFTGHKEPFSNHGISVPKLSFSKAIWQNDRLIMHVSINVNHALVDGYHVSLFAEKFQEFLNE